MIKLIVSIRKVSFVKGEFYHVYNRGVDKRNIFLNEKDIKRFLQSMGEFNVIDPIGSIYENSFRKKNFQLGGKASKLRKRKLVNFIAYCLNDNHYHFILEQVSEDGIKNMMHRIGTGYTRFFNDKYKRSGSLFQGKFKAIHIDSNEYLLHLSVYVNLNNRVHQLGGKASKLVLSKSSWDEYIGKSQKDFCEKDIVLGQFKNNLEYQKFAESSLQDIFENKQKQKELDCLLLE